eukprot:10998920-Lingulodinium_polyedra.AAC.1
MLAASETAETAEESTLPKRGNTRFSKRAHASSATRWAVCSATANAFCETCSTTAVTAPTAWLAACRAN